jgi:hypothetical protein
MAEFKSPLTREETLKRFRFILIALRATSGISFLYESVSLYFNIYSAATMFVFYSTVISGIADLLVHTDDIVRTMETLRTTIPSIMFALLHISLRYQSLFIYLTFCSTPGYEKHVQFILTLKKS